MAGKRVMVTRAAEQSESLVHALEAEGAVVVLVPLVAFGPPDDISLLDEALQDLRRYDWILLTSQNAVSALLECGETPRISLAQAVGTLHVAAVGPATADAARQAGLHVDFIAAKHQGSALVEELAERIRGERVLLPRSDRANPELVEKLAHVGAKVTDVVAYKTARPVEQIASVARAMSTKGVDAVLFFSPSAAHHLQDILGDEQFRQFSRRTLFAAIGPVTEQALRKMNAPHVVMAKDTTVIAVIAVLRDYFMARQLKLPSGASPK
ncbi:MAG: uroporphyrinogen-III synthase [Candidatus Acidiferrum sp.]